ncbi:unnamed protein product [Linum tenue]|uniref:B box-type domain-containing protein n=1 Tax=Linum tenue TaxID=586396 RepID=A0AAV0IVL1_9ROSI|nr:unnamed protein product [Linum tenue]
MGREDRLNHHTSYYNNNNYYCWSSSTAAEMVSGGDGEAAAGKRRMGRRRKKEVEVEVPAWLSGLMGESFFGSCVVHEERRKKEKNVYCLLCCHSICPHCLPAQHRHHPFLQVRRYVYHDVVRLGDLEKLIDCSYIQSYTINSAKVIFVKERPQTRSGGKAVTAHNVCFSCDRILQHPFHFCSLSCKVNHMVEGGEELGSILVMGGGRGTMNQAVVDDEEEEDDGAAAAGGSEDMAFSQFEDLRMDSSEITDDDEAGGQAQLFNSMPPYHHRMMMTEADPSSTATNQMTRKKKHGPSESGAGGFLQAGITALSFGSRRKGAPHRAPLS